MNKATGGHRCGFGEQWWRCHGTNKISNEDILKQVSEKTKDHCAVNQKRIITKYSNRRQEKRQRKTTGEDSGRKSTAERIACVNHKLWSNLTVNKALPDNTWEYSNISGL
jgi:hypothetical protein